MSERDTILSHRENLDIDDVALMICFATGNIPSDPQPDTQVGKEPMDEDILGQARHYLELLPVDAPEWSVHVPNFLTAVSEILSRKELERESLTAVRALDLQVADLGQFSGKLSYLELDINSWKTPVDLSAAEATRLTGLLTEFKECLEKYDPVPHLGNSLSETQRLREEHDQASRNIQELKERIDQLLSVGTETIATDQTPALEGETEVGDLEPSPTAEISDIKLSDGAFEFNPMLMGYFLEVENTVALLVVKPVASHPDATIHLTFDTPTGETIEASELDDGEFVVSPLHVGLTVIRIRAFLGDSNPSDVYTLSVTRPQVVAVAPLLNTDATLKSLTLSSETIDFTPTVTRYSIDLNEQVNGLTLNLERTHGSASVIVTADLPDGTTIKATETEDLGYLIATDLISQGDIEIHIRVTAEDKETTQLYVVVARQEAATDFTASLWNFVAQDDLAGAYWFARAMTHQGFYLFVPTALLKAAQGGRWLSADSNAFVEDLFYVVGESEIDADEDPQILLRLAAALLPSLVAPETNLLAWLAAPRCLPGIDAVLSPVRAFANAGYALHAELVSGDQRNQHLQGLIAQASAEARQWLEEAPQNQTKFTRAVRVLQYLCREGTLKQMLTPVAEDNREKLRTVQNLVELLERDGYAEIIDQAETSMGLQSTRSSHIVGNARDWLVNRIEEARARAIKWSSLVSRELEGRSATSNDWLLEQVSNLRGQLQDEFPSVLEGLLELSREGNPPALVATAKCAVRSMQQMADYLNLEYQQGALEQGTSAIHRLRTISTIAQATTDNGGSSGQLEIALSRRLLWAPSVDLDDNGQPVSDDSLIDLTASPESFDLSSMTLGEVIQRRMDRHDFRFFEILTYGLLAEEVDPLRRRFSTELAAEKRTLQVAIESTREAVEQAEKDGVIEFEGSLWNKHNNSLDDIDAEELLYFKAQYDALDGIKGDLSKERNRGAEELMAEWQSLESEFDSGSDRDPNFLARVRSTFEIASSIDSLDIRVMEDCVSQVRNRQSGEEDSRLRTNEGELQYAALEDFQDFYRAIRDPKTQAKASEGLNTLVQDLMREI